MKNYLMLGLLALSLNACVYSGDKNIYKNKIQMATFSLYNSYSDSGLDKITVDINYGLTGSLSIIAAKSCKLNPNIDGSLVQKDYWAGPLFDYSDKYKARTRVVIELNKTKDISLDGKADLFSCDIKAGSVAGSGYMLTSGSAEFTEGSFELNQQKVNVKVQ